MDKIFILLFIFFLLFIFYLVISLGATRKKKEQSYEIKKYLKGVRVLIIILALVASMLWFFL